MSRPAKAMRSLPPNENELVFKRVMAAVRRMSPQEIFQTSVAAGIHKPNGELTAEYLPRPAKRSRKRSAASR